MGIFTLKGFSEANMHIYCIILTPFKLYRLSDGVKQTFVLF